MKTTIRNYSFSVAGKTITLTDVATIRLDRLLLIIDVTTNKILYNFADSTVSTATVATNVITLSVLQGGEANGDKLQVIYDTLTTDTAFGDTTEAVQILSSVLPTGAATSAAQTTAQTSLSSIDGKITAVNTGAVTVASSALPTGASTSASQTTGNNSLASLDTKTPALGQALAAASSPVVLPAASVTALTPPAAITNFANETGGNLAAIKADVDKIPSQGQALAAASTPVVLPATQITTLTPPANTGYALDATLTGGTQKTKLVDTAGTNVAVIDTNNRLHVKVANEDDGSPIGRVYLVDSTNTNRVNVNSTGGLNIGDSTNTVNVLKSDGTAAGQNSQLVAPANQTIPFTTSTPGAQNLLANTNVSNYSWITIVTTSVGSGLAWSAQFSPNSGGTYIQTNQWQDKTSGTSTPGLIGTGNNKIYSGPVLGGYFQLIVSALTSGTLSGYVILSTFPQSAAVITGTVGSNSATGSAVPANAFYIAASNGSGNLTGLSSLNGSADGTGSNSAGLVSFTYSQVYNGTTWDRGRNNTTGVVIAAGATASNAGVTTTTYNASKAVIVANISAFTSGSLTIQINGITSSGYSYPILTSTALAAAAVTALRIFPGATAAANLVASDMVPRSLQVVTTVTGTLTYGIDYELSV